MLWSTRTRGTVTKSKGLTEILVDGAVTQTTDVVFGSESVPSTPVMNKTEEQPHRKIHMLTHQVLIKKRNLWLMDQQLSKVVYRQESRVIFL